MHFRPEQGGQPVHLGFTDLAAVSPHRPLTPRLDRRGPFTKAQAQTILVLHPRRRLLQDGLGELERADRVKGNALVHLRRGEVGTAERKMDDEGRSVRTVGRLRSGWVAVKDTCRTGQLFET